MPLALSGVAALWATGYADVKFLYQVISIAVDLFGTAHTNCLALRKSADALFGKITDAGNEVIQSVVGFSPHYSPDGVQRQPTA